MPHHADDSQTVSVTGTLQFSDIEGGIWTLVLDESHAQLGDQVVVQAFPEPMQLGDGAHVCARVRVAQAQFGIAMAGTYVDVLELSAE